MAPLCQAPALPFKFPKVMLPMLLLEGQNLRVFMQPRQKWDGWEKEIHRLLPSQDLI